MHVRTQTMTIFLSSASELSQPAADDAARRTARPSRIDTPMMQGKAPAAQTQGGDSTTGKDTSSTAAAPSQPSDAGTNAMASPSDDRTKTDDAAKQKGSS